MRVAVTGAAGSVGRVVVSRLLQEGIEVVGIDKTDAHIGGKLIVADLCNLGHVFTALVGADAVIHLGAIPSPFGAPADVIYRNNVLAQFNVFEAAGCLDIQRVVNISSVSALGFPFQIRPAKPLYFPIDEEHPLLPQDCYGLSKVVGEQVAAAYCRRTGGCAASLRFSTVLTPYELQRYKDWIDRICTEPSSGASDLWSYVDIRDVADACFLALTTPLEGHQPFYVTAADTTCDLPTDELLQLCYPDVPCRPGDRPSHWSLLDNTRAQQILGYQPRHHWREVLEECAI